jgi:hypothetical protein
LKLHGYNFDEFLDDWSMGLRQRVTFMGLISAIGLGSPTAAQGTGQTNSQPNAPEYSNTGSPPTSGTSTQPANETQGAGGTAQNRSSVGAGTPAAPAAPERTGHAARLSNYVARAHPDHDKATLGRFYAQAVNDRLRAEMMLTQLAKESGGKETSILLKPTSPIEEYRAGSGAGEPA